MQQQLLEQYSQYPDQASTAMDYGYDAKVNASDRAGETAQPVTVQSGSESTFVWHCSEYDF